MITYESVYKNTKDFRVLYVEDDEICRREANDIFLYFFYKIDLACDGADGLEKYVKFFSKHNRYYDLVITDISMPKMDGVELSRAIKDTNPTQNIVVISAYDNSQNLIELINIGVNNFLLKPIDYNKILEIFFYIGSGSKKISKMSYEIKNDDVSVVKIDDEYAWDKESSTIIYNNRPIHLTNKEKLLMELLIRNGSHISTNEEILEVLWDSTDSALNKNLTPILSRLRKKLPKDIIKTQYGLGYRLTIY